MNNALLWVLGTIAVVIIVLLLVPGKESKEKLEETYQSEGKESAISKKIESLLKKAKEEFILLNDFTLKGWIKHKATIQHLLITKKGLYIFRTFAGNGAKPIKIKNGEWFEQAGNSEKKIKNPINMNNYRINIIRNILKKKLESLYDKLDFRSVIVVKGDADLPVSSKEKGNTMLIKEQFIPDFVDMITQMEDKITSEEMRRVREALT